MSEPAHQNPALSYSAAPQQAAQRGRFQRACRPAWGLLVGLGAALLSACSDEAARRENSELRVEQPAANTAAEAPDAGTATTPDAADGPASMNSRYRVTAETAYFFDSPQQARPSGHYLRRGDVVYGEDDTNGFVKTRFVNPSGATVTGWLKAEELSLLSLGPATRPARTAARPAPRPAPVESAADENEVVENESVNEVDSPVSGSQTAVVQVARSYFYDSPDLLQARRAHCVRGDKVQLGETQGEAVYVTFTNWEKVTTTGWMRKDALRFTR